MKVTPDTNFLISATQWDNSVSHKLLVKLIQNDAEIFTTPEILTEFAEVLARDFKLDNEKIEEILTFVINIVKIIEPLSKINVVEEDPDDNKVLECAIASSSDYILTYDNHLLKFKSYRGIKVIKPEELFEKLK